MAGGPFFHFWGLNPTGRGQRAGGPCKTEAKLPGQAGRPVTSGRGHGRAAEIFAMVSFIL